MNQIKKILNILTCLIFAIILNKFSLFSQNKVTKIELSNGSVNSSSNNYNMKATLNMNPISENISINNEVNLGFWYSQNSISTEPTVQSKSITYHSTSKNRIGLKWTKGNGANRVILASKSNFLNSCYLKDGKSISFGDFGSVEVPNNEGVYSVFNGSNTSCLVEGLSRNTTYYFKIIEYNGSGSTANYLQTNASGNPGSRSTSKKEGEEIDGTNVISIYPNPVKDVLNINLNLPFENATISIINEVGQEVYNSLNPSDNLNINTLNFSNGVYHIIISNGNEMIYNSFVIER